MYEGTFAFASPKWLSSTKRIRPKKSEKSIPRLLGSTSVSIFLSNAAFCSELPFIFVFVIISQKAALLIRLSSKLGRSKAASLLFKDPVPNDSNDDRVRCVRYCECLLDNSVGF